MNRSMTRRIAVGCAAFVALGAAAVFAAESVVATVSDPDGDTVFKRTPAFQDIIRGQLTKTAEGDFEMLMEMAGSVPDEPSLPRPGVSQIWWMWFFDDPATSPKGYPASPGFDGGREFVVYVSWDGSEFAGIAVDRRPLLTGGDPVITSVPFSVEGAIVAAVLPAESLGDFPQSFVWGPRTIDWSGPLGSAGFHPVDDAESIFNP